MGSRGPRPDPNSARTADGRNTSASRPRPVSGPVAAPSHLAASTLAMSFWDMHAPSLVESGRLRPEMAESFAMLCHIYADCRQLTEQLAAEGWISASEKGQTASPIAKLLRDARRDFVALAEKFGLTAASDSRLPQDPTDGKEETDSEAALLQKLKVRAL